MENNDKLILLKEILVAQINHLAYMPIIMTICVVLGYTAIFELQYIIIFELFLFVPLILYFSRIKVSKFIIKLLIHVALFAIPILLPFVAVFYKVFMAILVGMYFILSWIRGGKKEKEDSAINIGLILGICFSAILIINKLNCTGHDFIFYIISVIEIAFAFFDHYIKQYFKFLSVNNSSASHIPAKEMLKSGSELISIYTVLTLISIMIVANLKFIGNIFASFNNLIKMLLLKLIALIPSSSNVDVVIDPDAAQNQMIEAMSISGDEAPTFWFWLFLEKVIMIFVYAGLIALFIFVAIKIYKFIKSRLGQRSESTNRLNESMVEVREKCIVPSEERFSITKLFKPQTTTEKIRALYKKKLLADKDKIIGDSNKDKLNTVTAREAAEKLSLRQLALIYEKARYSNVECTAEDLKLMKEECK